MLEGQIAAEYRASIRVREADEIRVATLCEFVLAWKHATNTSTAVGSEMGNQPSGVRSTCTTLMSNEWSASLQTFGKVADSRRAPPRSYCSYTRREVNSNSERDSG